MVLSGIVRKLLTINRFETSFGSCQLLVWFFQSIDVLTFIFTEERQRAEGRRKDCKI
jgi:hypothetical protein